MIDNIKKISIIRGEPSESKWDIWTILFNSSDNTFELLEHITNSSIFYGYSSLLQALVDVTNTGTTLFINPSNKCYVDDDLTLWAILLGLDSNFRYLCKLDTLCAVGFYTLCIDPIADINYIAMYCKEGGTWNKYEGYINFYNQYDTKVNLNFNGIMTSEFGDLDNNPQYQNWYYVNHDTMDYTLAEIKGRFHLIAFEKTTSGGRLDCYPCNNRPYLVKDKEVDNLYIPDRLCTRFYSNLIVTIRRLYSAYFDVYFSDKDTAYVTSTNGYIGKIVRNGQFFKLEKLVRPDVYFDNNDTAISGIGKYYNQDYKCCNIAQSPYQNIYFNYVIYFRSLFPAFAIDGIDNNVFYSVGKRLFYFSDFNDIKVLEFAGGFPEFIIDLKVLKKNNLFNIFTVEVDTDYGLYNQAVDSYVPWAPFSSNNGNIYFVRYYQIAPGSNTYIREVLFTANVNYTTQITYFYAYFSEHFSFWRNIARLSKDVDDTIFFNYYSKYVIPTSGVFKWVRYRLNDEILDVYNEMALSIDAGSSIFEVFTDQLVFTVADSIDVQSTIITEVRKYIYNNLNQQHQSTIQIYNPYYVRGFSIFDICKHQNDKRLILLENCQDSNDIIYPDQFSNIDSSLVGKTVKLEGYNTCCYKVKEDIVDCLKDIVFTHVTIESIYDNCLECLGFQYNYINYDKRYLAYKPGLNLGLCDLDVVFRAMNKFGSNILANYFKEAYRVKTCCSDDLKLLEAYISYQMIMMDIKRKGVCDKVDYCIMPICWSIMLDEKNYFYEGWGREIER